MFCHYTLYVCTLFVMCMYACVGDCTLLIMDCIFVCASMFSYVRPLYYSSNPYIVIVYPI